MSDPLKELIEQSLGLMNPSFAPPGKMHSARCEFYHQFRKLWDRGIPVGMGLGHLLLIADDDTVQIERLGEQGKPTETIANVIFSEQIPIIASNHPAPCYLVAHDGKRWSLVNG